MNHTFTDSPGLLGVTAGGAFIIAIIGTSGNLMAVVALRQNKKLRNNPSTAFMVNLPACLLPVCAIGMPLFGGGCLQMKYTGHISISDDYIVAVFTAALILSQVHLHTICALAFNRLLAVMWPPEYKRLMQRRNVLLYLAVLWVYSALLWLPLACGALGGLKFVERELMVSMDETQGRLWKGLHVFVTYMLPVIFASTCYITMYIKVRFSRRTRKVRARRKSVVSPEEEAVRQWDDHVTRTILVIFVIMVSCCVPHLVVHMFHLYDHYPAAWLLLHLIFWVQFCLDPIVYVTVSCQYRAACADTVQWFLQSVGLGHLTESYAPTTGSSNVPSTPNDYVTPKTPILPDTNKLNQMKCDKNSTVKSEV